MKKVIFTDDISDYIDINKDYIIDNFKEINGKEPNDDEITNEANNLLNYDCDDFNALIDNFDKNINYLKIMIVASFGLWYGRRDGVYFAKTLSEAIYKACKDNNTFYFTAKNSTLNLCAIHHDGRNYYKFYAIDEHGKKHAIKEKDLLK